MIGNHLFLTIEFVSQTIRIILFDISYLTVYITFPLIRANKNQRQRKLTVSSGFI